MSRPICRRAGSTFPPVISAFWSNQNTIRVSTSYFVFRVEFCEILCFSGISIREANVTFEREKLKYSNPYSISLKLGKKHNILRKSGSIQV